jgi:mannose/fructose-specific phosphotransferase system component IIA
MSEGLKGIVLTHAELSESLVRAVYEITGDDESLVAISNAGLGHDRLCDLVAELTLDSPTVVFVDLPGGSCLQAVVTATREKTDVALVSGVNLPMLLDFVFNRNSTAVEAAKRATSVGTQAIKAIGT